MGKRFAVGLLAAIVVAVLGAVLKIGPRNVLGMLRYDTRREGDLRVGDPAPDVSLLSPDGQTVHLASRFGARPLVVIFGSFT